MAATTRRVLLIAYQFPPVGGAGVQRVAKFTKYLPEHGWEVSVLTVSNPSVPVTDRSLLEEIPPQTIIRQAKSWEPGYRLKQTLTQGSPPDSRRAGWLTKIKRAVRNVATMLLQPDPQILWVPEAIRQGRRLLRELPHHAILVSGPPFSSFLVGAALRQFSGLPLVLDYRDEWTRSNCYWENKSHHPFTQWVQHVLQKLVIRHADTAIATTQRSARTLEQESRNAGRPIPVRCLYNGFDPADLPQLQPRVAERDGRRFRLSHVGTLWNLTTSRALVEAIERLASRSPDLASRLEIELVGRCTTAEESLLQRLQKLPCRLLRQEYVDHSSAVRVMGEADELCLLLSDVPGAERVVPGKTFEYLATGRAILAITPEGELRDVLRGFAGVSVFSPQDVAGLCEHLERRLAALSPETSHTRELAGFDRRQQAGQLAEVLGQVAASVSARSNVGRNDLVDFDAVATAD
ncbi:MAG: glycosyltransferase [Planctomycetota bacterium]|nr:glycosyltransferase [Planctomycetota bacterium]